jgi:aryl sulfotransferase
MSTHHPGQGTSYFGPITDTSRWENFRHRPDDIFICTPPKCGTTWTQAICAMLVFGKVDHGIQSSQSSPWVDAKFAPIDDYLEQIEAQTHRRYLKTHTPLDGIPYYPECSYLVVCRDPRDVYCSNINHRDNMTDEELAFNVFTSGDQAFQDWITREQEPGGWDIQSLQLVTHFLQTYWDSRDLPNIHLFHYSDMKRDLRGSIATMAAALSIDLDDELLDAMSEAASFESMKKNARNHAPEAGRDFWKQDSGFFASGQNEQWRELLSDADLEAFDARLAQLVTPEQADWLLNGSQA